MANKAGAQKSSESEKYNNYAMYLLTKYSESILTESVDGGIVIRESEECLFREKEYDKLVRALRLRDTNNILLIGPDGVGKRNLVYKYVSNTFVDLNIDCVMSFRVKLVEMLVDCGDTTQLISNFENTVRLLSQVARKIASNPKILIYIEDMEKLPVRILTNIFIKMRSLSAWANAKFILAYNTDKIEDKISNIEQYLDNSEVIYMDYLTREQTEEVVKLRLDSIAKYHKCRFSKKVLDYLMNIVYKEYTAVSPRTILDLIDSCGAYKEEHKDEAKYGIITESIVKKVAYEFFGIDDSNLDTTDEEKVKTLNNKLKSNVFGQDKACDIVDKCIKIASVGLNDNDKTVCNLLFVGPTGVGKTELAKVVAKSLNVPMLKYNMTEYQDQISVNKLIGSAPGYVGYEEGGRLVSDVINNPKCVLLLDEIEKAHPSIYNMLLQVMDDAKLTDSLGRTAKFNDVILIMTSNAGASDIGTRKIGFEVDESKKIIKDEAMDAAVERVFLPEFINRLTEVVKFNFLDEKVGRKIIEKKTNELRDKLKERNIEVSITKKAEDYILKKGINNKFGAREIGRIFIKEINSKIADIIIDNGADNINGIEIYCKDDLLAVRKKTK